MQIKKKSEKKRGIFAKVVNLIIYEDFIARIFILQGAFFTAIIAGFLFGAWFNLNAFIQGILILVFYSIESCYLLLVYEHNLNIWYNLFGYILILIFLVKMF